MACGEAFLDLGENGHHNRRTIQLATAQPTGTWRVAGRYRLTATPPHIAATPPPRPPEPVETTEAAATTAPARRRPAPLSPAIRCSRTSTSPEAPR
jgi:hypothetical protein